MKKESVIKKKQVVKPVCVCMTDDDKKLVQSAAKESGVSFSQFVAQSAVYLAAN